MDNTAWAALALVLFLVVIWRMGAFKGMTGALDKRAQSIASSLAEAARLRGEAEALLQKSKDQQRLAEAEAQAIIAEAHRDAQALRAKLQQELEADLARRSRQAEERIARAEARAVADVQAAAARAAVAAAEQQLREAVSPAVQAQLVAQGASDVRTRMAS